MKQEQIIIDGRQNRKKRFFEYIVTGAGWSYVIIGLVQTIATLIIWILNITFTSTFIKISLQRTLDTLLFTFLVAVSAFIILYSWHHYNFKKYGKMFRRKMPTDSTIDDVVAIMNIEKTKALKLQKTKWIDLEESYQKRPAIKKRDD